MADDRNAICMLTMKMTPYQSDRSSLLTPGMPNRPPNVRRS